MHECEKDVQRSLVAVKAILDGRDPTTEFPTILLTTEHVIATILIAVMGDAKTAARMLNEGLLQGVEERLSLYRAREAQSK